MNFKFLILLTTLGLSIFMFFEKKYKFFIVQSGSMEPSLQIGDMILVKKEIKYESGETITFITKDNKTVTHRISQIKNENQYLTKGDANRNEDLGETDNKLILGKVIQVFPKVGLIKKILLSNLGFEIFFLFPFIYTITSQFTVNRR